MPRRWWIALLVTAAIAISYFDRQTLPVAIEAIRHDFDVSYDEYGNLVFAFLLSYGLMYMGGGALMDRLGTRRGFLIIMIFWSLACASHALAAGYGMLLASRFLLGLGEGGGFPAATRAVAEWFPIRERSTAMGLINAGTAVGFVLAAPLVALIVEYLNWRWVFLFAGGMGLLWTLWWAWDYFPVAQHPRVSPQECAEIEAGAPASELSAKTSWAELFSHREVWGLVLAKCLTDAAWYFYINWMPKFSHDIWNFETADFGRYLWIPAAASGFGSYLGGWFSSNLLGRGYSINAARKIALGASAALMPWVFGVTLSREPNLPLALLLLSLAFCGQQSWSTLVMTLPTDMFPRRVIGTVAGLVGFGGAVGGMIMNKGAGWLLQSLSDEGGGGVMRGYQIIFGVTSSCHVVAFILILLVIPRIRPVEMAAAEAV